MSKFEREKRYIVVKRKRLTDDQIQQLKNFINFVLYADEEYDCAVVENDWPIYEETWENVQRLVEGRPTIKQELDQLRATPTVLPPENVSQVPVDAADRAADN